MDVIVAVLGMLGLVFAILANTTNLVKFWQDQGERRKRTHPGGGTLEPRVAAATPAQPVGPQIHPAAPTILTPDQRLRVFISSTLQELAEERSAAQEAVRRLRLSPVLFELGARPHPPQELYRSYLGQSHIFVGIYWQRYGWVAPGEEISGLEDEYRLAGDRPKLIYVKTPAPAREDRLKALLTRVQRDDRVSYKPFETPEELRELLENDLALLLTEHFARPREAAPAPEPQSRLPLPATPLVGRAQELAEVKSLLLEQSVRLVTLLGPGGVGKSRLALELAHTVQDHFADGCYLVPLAPLRDPELVPDTIARTLGLSVSPGQSVVEGLKVLLRDRHLLLVLDNFERVLAAAPVVSELLTAAPRLEVVVTSREILRLSGEYVYPVPPLSLLERAETAPLERVRRAEAVRLFAARAKAVQPGFQVNEANAHTIAEICHKLDGLPLAIELAAARITLLSPAALLERLEHRLDTLTGGSRDLDPRQQTLRNTIDWSYDLLGGEEQAQFLRLSVAVGGCSLEAAEALCRDACGDVLAGLASLVDKSLISQQEVDGEPRFTMLETLREYALEKLEAEGQAETLRQLHAEYFVSFAETSAPLIRQGADQQASLKRLEREHDNIRAVMTWSLAGGGLEPVIRLAWALWLVWWVTAHTREGHHWLQEALAQVQRRSVPLSKAHLARLHGAAAMMAFWQGAYDAVPRLIETCLPLFRELGDRQGEGYALLTLGVTATSLGNWNEAETHLVQSAALFRAAQDDWGAHLANNGLGRNAVRQGKLDEAAAIFEESLRLTRQSSDRFAYIIALNGLGSVSLRQGEAVKATALFDESMRVCQQLGYLEGVAWSLEGLAVAAALQHDLLRAVRLMAASESLREAIQFPGWNDAKTYLDELNQRLRSSLAPPDFDAAWREGKALSLEAAVTYALTPAKRTPVARLGAAAKPLLRPLAARQPHLRHSVSATTRAKTSDVTVSASTPPQPNSGHSKPGKKPPKLPPT